MNKQKKNWQNAHKRTQVVGHSIACVFYIHQMLDIGCLKIFVGKRQTAKRITFPLKTGWIFLTKMFIIVIIFQTIQKIKTSKEMIFHENFT